MKKQNRRDFLTKSVAALAVTGSVAHGENLRVGPEPAGESAEVEKRSMIEELKRYRKIDSHAHVYFTPGNFEQIVDIADRLNIGKLIISRPMVPGGKGDPKEFKECNDLVLKAMKQFPDRFLGQLTLNPQHPKESIEEIKRCTGEGMIGVKLYNHVKINDPLFYPIIEKFIDLKMIVLMHMGIGIARVKYDAREPKGVSIPEDMVEAAIRYPEGKFQLAHIGGGIDWEAACKAVASVPNIAVDISGSNNAAHMIDFAIKCVGEDRLYFGCDNSFYQGVGHVLGANLTDTQRKKLFFDNYNKYLKSIGRNVD
jgi:predicted TIM-barrel fold metal-dependent hydrolase